ncbi:MAG: PKD domain-containing protein, partial [Candidatus Thiodiazotropha sp.]
MSIHPRQLFSVHYFRFPILSFICLFLVFNELEAALVTDAGPDQIVSVGEIVQLDGSASVETDGFIASYEWYQARGPEVTVNNHNDVIANFLMPENAELEFVLRLVSDSGEVAVDRIVVQSDPFTNISPSANAGIDQIIDAGEMVQLDASGSHDSDGTIERYNWHQYRGPVVTLQDSRSATPSFTMPPNAELAFTVVVTDNSGSIGRDSVLVSSTVNTNQVPIANAGVDQTADAGVVVQLDASGSHDSDGTIERYTWHQYRGPAVTLQDPRSATPSFTMPPNAELAFTVVVTDNSGSIGRDSVLISSTVNTNQVPIANAGVDQTADAGVVVQLDASGSHDSDGTIERYNWHQYRGPVVTLQDSRSATPSFTMPPNAELAFTVVVTDNSGSIGR